LPALARFEVALFRAYVPVVALAGSARLGIRTLPKFTAVEEPLSTKTSIPEKAQLQNWRVGLSSVCAIRLRTAEQETGRMGRFSVPLN
jgi:hypothetical protein